MAAVLPLAWFARPAEVVAPALLGQVLVRQFAEGQPVLRSLIVETEAYTPEDPACHGYRRKTARNAAMFGPPGTVYVYQIYGRYHCLNLATDREGAASAVLIRALALPGGAGDRDAAGPGKLCQVLQIDRSLNGSIACVGQPLWVEAGSHDPGATIVQTTRIGLSQGRDLPWRWYLAGHPAVSRPAPVAGQTQKAR